MSKQDKIPKRFKQAYDNKLLHITKAIVNYELHKFVPHLISLIVLKIIRGKLCI